MNRILAPIWSAQTFTDCLHRVSRLREVIAMELVNVIRTSQREAHWQVTDGCRTNKYMQALVDTVRACVYVLV